MKNIKSPKIGEVWLIQSEQKYWGWCLVEITDVFTVLSDTVCRGYVLDTTDNNIHIPGFRHERWAFGPPDILVRKIE